MPVFQGEPFAPVFTAEQRMSVLEQLARELAEDTVNGPVIFEIPFQPPDKFDVLVVWDAWEPFSSEDRGNIILDAYKDRKPSTNIAQALGVTHQEAIEQQVLPYTVIPMVRQGEVEPEVLKRAMIAEGGIALANGKVDLRFPTMAFAEKAHRRLSDKLPKGYWSIIQTVASNL